MSQTKLVSYIPDHYAEAGGSQNSRSRNNNNTFICDSKYINQCFVRRDGIASPNYSLVQLNQICGNGSLVINVLCHQKQHI